MSKCDPIHKARSVLPVNFLESRFVTFLQTENQRVLVHARYSLVIEKCIMSPKREIIFLETFKNLHLVINNISIIQKLCVLLILNVFMKIFLVELGDISPVRITKLIYRVYLWVQGHIFF